MAARGGKMRGRRDPDPDDVERAERSDDLGFRHQVTRERTVFVSWHGRTVLTVSGRAAARLLQRLEGLDPAAAQIVLAKVTGNFKRGNERGR